MSRASLLFLLVLASSCSYTSEYVPPADGRARLVWQDDAPTARVPAPGPDCAAATALQLGLGPAAEPGDEGGYRGPSYVWPVVFVDLPVHHSHPRPSAAPPPSGAHGATPVGSRHASAPSPPSGGKGSEDYSKLGPLLAVAAAVAIVSMPFVAIGLAASPSESPVKTAGAIDHVNAANDLLRTPGSACNAPPAEAPPPEVPSTSAPPAEGLRP